MFRVLYRVYIIYALGLGLWLKRPKYSYFYQATRKVIEACRDPDQIAAARMLDMLQKEIYI